MPFEDPEYICYWRESYSPPLGPPDWVDSQIEQLAIHWRLDKDKAISTCKDCLHLTQLDSRMTRATARCWCVLSSWLMFDYQLNISVLDGRAEDGIKNEADSRTECAAWVWVNEVIQYSIGGWRGVLTLDRWPQALIWLTLFLACLYLHVHSADGGVERVIDVINYQWLMLTFFCSNIKRH